MDSAVPKLECLPIDHGGPVDWPFEYFPYTALDRPIIEHFEAAARRFATRVAVSDRTRDLTYSELAVLADRIAAATAAATAGRPGPVAILLPREVTYPAAMLGVLAAGRGCVPLDPGNPDERNQLIARQSGAAAVVSASGLANRVRMLFSQDFPLVNVEELDGAPVAEPSARPTADDLAVIVYTSGSTGRPKGAYHSHRNILHDVMQQTNTLHANGDDRIALVYSPTVIGAVREILITLLNGGSLHILPPNELQPAGLVREIRKRGITILRLVPALLRRVVEALGLDERLDSVRVLGITSQRVDWSDYDLFRRYFSPDAFLITGYGSTECGGNVAHWFVDQRLRATSPRLPIGRMLPDARLTIADENGRPVPDGQVGEIVVSSRYLGLGYWREPELTARAFSTDPVDPASRMFRTGDMGRLRPDGLLEHAGRNDQQIKIRGHRIELAEVESTLADCPGVEDAAIVIRKDEVDLPRSLAAYVEPGPGVPELRPRDLVSALTKRLPRYMVPGSIHVLDRLPRLSNLKIDRVRLAEIDAMRLAPGGNPVDDPLLGDLIGIFETVLNISGATPEDNTSSLGGDSLQAVRIAIEIETRFQVSVPPGVFESLSTIRELARWIATQQHRDPSGAITAPEHIQ